MPTRILIVGSGGREHALAWKLANEPGVNRVVVAPGSDGIATVDRVACAPDVDSLDAAALVALARREAVELAVIGPEAPLAAGVADALLAAGVATFGPTRAAARIETSKAFCREVAAAAGVRMARGAAFDDPEDALAFARGLVSGGRGVVVKLDGLDRRQGRDDLRRPCPRRGGDSRGIPVEPQRGARRRRRRPSSSSKSASSAAKRASLR